MFTSKFRQFHLYIVFTSVFNDIKLLIVHFSHIYLSINYRICNLIVFFNPSSRLLFLPGFSHIYFDLSEYIIILLFIYSYEKRKKKLT